MDVAFCWVVDVVRLRTEEDGTIKRSNMITSTLFLSSNNTLSETKNIYSSKKTFIISLLSFCLKIVLLDNCSYFFLNVYFKVVT